ncbi:hypothetical protein HSRCO_2268 [Halanaeroarchaeum sp. HSR-CO]|nr:hypothetical protein HSRCO_2268 [Halanaeroarchaeum sp. HSR-CO]
MAESIRVEGTETAIGRGPMRTSMVESTESDGCGKRTVPQHRSVEDGRPQKAPGSIRPIPRIVKPRQHF